MDIWVNMLPLVRVARRRCADASDEQAANSVDMRDNLECVCCPWHQYFDTVLDKVYDLYNGLAG